jgi:hypothetical protein
MGLQSSITRPFKHDSPCTRNTISRVDRRRINVLATRAFPNKCIFVTFGVYGRILLPCQPSNITVCTRCVKLVSCQSNMMMLMLGTCSDAVTNRCRERYVP